MQIKTRDLTFGYKFNQETREVRGEQDRLRYSALATWLASPDQYRKRYYQGETFYNKEMAFGHVIHKTMEDKVAVSLHPVLSKLPQMPVSEYNIELEAGGIKIGGCLDAFDPETFSFLDYKSSHMTSTGKAPWDKVRVAKHMQLVFYSLLIKKAHGKVDPYTQLVWIETDWIPEEYQIGSRNIVAAGDKLQLTGKFEVFKRRIAQWERDALLKTIKKAAVEIDEDFNNWKKTQ